MQACEEAFRQKGSAKGPDRILKGLLRSSCRVFKGFLEGFLQGSATALVTGVSGFGPKDRTSGQQYRSLKNYQYYSLRFLIIIYIYIYIYYKGAQSPFLINKAPTFWGLQLNSRAPGPYPTHPNVGALIIKIGSWGFPLIITIPKPCSLLTPLHYLDPLCLERAG